MYAQDESTTERAENSHLSLVLGYSRPMQEGPPSAPLMQPFHNIRFPGAGLWFRGLGFRDAVEAFPTLKLPC